MHPELLLTRDVERVKMCPSIRVWDWVEMAWVRC